MTIIVGYIYKKRFLLAADSQATLDDGTICSHKCQKIQHFGNFVVAASGSSVALMALNRILSQCEDSQSRLDIKLHGMKTGLPAPSDHIEEDDFYGQAIVLELDDNSKIIEMLEVTIRDTLLVDNIYKEGNDLTTLGSGGTLFRGAFAAGPTGNCVKTAGEAKQMIKMAMDIVAAQSAYCNNVYTTEAYDIYV